MLVAIAGLILPFAMGFAYMHWRGDAPTESIFVGVAMVATSVGITARVLGDMGVLSSRTAKIILGAAVFDDILGMLLLAVVDGLAQGGGVEWVRLGVLAVGGCAICAVHDLYRAAYSSRLRPTVTQLSTHNAPLIVALMVCLGLSFAAARIGMAAIIGAFFAGMIFSECSPEWDLRPRVHAITEFLGPFFFFSIGSQLNVKLFNGEVLGVAAIVSLWRSSRRLSGVDCLLSGKGGVQR